MKFASLGSAALAALLCVSPLMADEAAAEKNAKPADDAQTMAMPKPIEIDPAEFLAMIPDVIATYGDGKEIKGDGLKALMKVQLEMMGTFGQPILPEDFAQVLPSMVEEIAMQEIVAVEAEKRGIKPNLDEIRKNVETIQKAPGGQQRIDQALQLFDCKSMDDLIAKQGRMKAAADLVQMEANKGLVGVAEVTDKEINELYEMTKERYVSLSASHILVKFNNRDDEEAKPTPEEEEAALKKIKSIQKLLLDGGDFAEIAKQFSDCPSRDKGGDLGQFSKGEMVKEFEEALLKMKPNEISGPVKTRFGYHLIKAGETTIKPEAQVKNEIKEIIEKSKKLNAQQNACGAFLRQLRKDYKLEIKVKAPELPAASPAGEKK